jgi:hypothetical protein
MTAEQQRVWSRAEELLATLPTVVGARVAWDGDAVDTVHVLVTGEVSAKQMVRNVESALAAALGVSVDHRKVSVAVSDSRPRLTALRDEVEPTVATIPATPTPVTPLPVPPRVADQPTPGRAVYFEDVEFRGSRSKGSACRVTLRRGDEHWVGEAEGMDSSRSRAELAARAALSAVRQFEGSRRPLELVGVKRVEAFETTFVFVAVETWLGRERALLTGSCELRESAEVSAALAVLDATNRWLEL